MVPSVRRHVLHLTMAIAIVAIPLHAVFATNATPQLGLDLQGGSPSCWPPRPASRSSPTRWARR